MGNRKPARRYWLPVLLIASLFAAGTPPAQASPPKPSSYSCTISVGAIGPAKQNGYLIGLAEIRSSAGCGKDISGAAWIERYGCDVANLLVLKRCDWSQVGHNTWLRSDATGTVNQAGYVSANVVQPCKKGTHLYRLHTFQSYGREAYSEPRKISC